MKNLLNNLTILFVLAFYLSAPGAFAGQTSDRWIEFVFSSSKHEDLHRNHPYYKSIREGNIDLGSLAVFLRDRVLFMEYFERRFQGQIDSLVSESSIPRELLIRSPHYSEELRKFGEDSLDMNPSQAAQDYVTYLIGLSEERALLHYLVYLGGEPNGVGSLSRRITRQHEGMGTSLTEFGQDENGEKLRRKPAEKLILNQVADAFFPDDRFASGNLLSDEDVKAEVDQLFKYASEMFTAAHAARGTSGTAPSTNIDAAQMCPFLGNAAAPQTRCPYTQFKNFLGGMFGTVAEYFSALE